AEVDRQVGRVGRRRFPYPAYQTYLTYQTYQAYLVPASNARSGCIVNDRTAPTSSRPIDPRKGRCQLPVRSMMMPNTNGDRMPASADPVFMMPLAVPEWRPAMSIGIDHMGPITSSAKKNAAARLTMIVVRSRVAKIASSERNDPAKPATTTLRRALSRSPVRRRMASLTVPPRRSPATPAP